MSDPKPKDNNALVEVIASELRKKMTHKDASIAGVSYTERTLMRLIEAIKGDVKKERWPQILHACLHGMAERTADMSVAGQVVGTLWALDPSHRMSQDDIRDFCLGGHHDELLKLLDSRKLKEMIGLC